MCKIFLIKIEIPTLHILRKIGMAGFKIEASLKSVFVFQAVR